MLTVHQSRARLPREAERLRLPIYRSGQERMRERYGFDVNAPDALDQARAARGGDSRDAGAAIALAAVLASRGDSAGAEAEARAAIELDPTLARAHTTLASIRMLQGDIPGALEQARLAATLDGNDATVQYNLGLAEHASGDKRAAREAMRRAESALESAAAGDRPRRRHWWSRG